MSGAASVAKSAAAQLPKPGDITLDHVAHFVPEMDTAAPALEKLGFTLTPFSAQSHRLEPGGPLVPAGTGNRCMMFKRGYVECLTPTGDSPVANQLRTAIKRYVGVHLIAFGTSAPEADHARLVQGGFSPNPPLALQRQISIPDGEDTARFTVVRVAPDTMPEGRIQYCQHHTPDLVWQPRWLAHANHAVALTAVILCVDDPAAVALRYCRFYGLETYRRGRSMAHRYATGAAAIHISRGDRPRVQCATRRRFHGSRDTCWRVTTSKRRVNMLPRTGFAHGALDASRLYVVPPASVGGIIVFEPARSCRSSFLRAPYEHFV